MSSTCNDSYNGRFDELLAKHDTDASHLKSVVERWARDRQAWHDSGWYRWNQCVSQPSDWWSVYLASESSLIELATIWDQLSWIETVEPTPFEYDLLNHYTIVFAHKDASVREAVNHRSQLEWLSQLLSPDIAVVHEAVYAHFRDNPEDIGRLPWRRLEELVAAAFAGQGISTTLGPGRSDGGIDLRLLGHPVFGDVITAVQVKSGRHPIRLHFVQALAAAAQADGADRALFVTSSRYLPGAIKWSEAWSSSQRTALTLATPADVAEWCAAAADRVWYPDHRLRDPQPRGPGPEIGSIVCARDGWRLISYNYGLVVRQTHSAILMRMLSTKIVDGDAQRGTEIPIVSEPDANEVYLAAVRAEGKDYWTGTDGNLYSKWDGRPKHFDLMN